MTALSQESSKIRWLHFHARLRLRGINAYVLVSAKRASMLKSNWRKPMPVLVRLDGLPRTPCRINMMPTGNGDFYLYLHGIMRAASRTKVGDTVTVELRFDRRYRGGPMHPMPKWFAVALHADAKASEAWRLLPPSRQKEVLRYFAGLKSDGAKARNLERALHALSGGTVRFMGRTWRGGK